MALHRRVTLPNMPAGQFVHGRAHNSLDQERQDFERNQINAVVKSLSLEECTPKEKHVRTLVVGTFQYHGCNYFWRNVKDYASLHGNEVVCWKFLVVLYRIIQDGHQNCVKESLEELDFIAEVSKYHINSRTELASYGRLTKKLGSLLNCKLLFHAKYPEIPGNLIVKESTWASFDAAKNFELCVDLLDLLESIIQLKTLVLDTFTPTKAHSMTHSGQCRLSAVIPSTNESSRIIDILGKLLRFVHRALPWDTLDGHRQRFSALYNELRKVYEKLSTFQYLKGILQVPRLSPDLSHFMDSLHRLQDEVQAGEAQFYHEEEDVSSGGDLITVDNSDNSLAFLQAEYSDLSAKYQNVLMLLQSEKQSRDKVERELQSRVAQFQSDVETMKKQHELAIAAAAASASAAVTASDEAAKLEKLKNVYQKLRQDHITLLRQKADLEKEKRELEEASKNSQIEDAVRSFLSKFGIDNVTDLAGALLLAEEKFEHLTNVSSQKNEQIGNLQSRYDALLTSQDEEKNKVLTMQSELSMKDETIGRLNSKLEELRISVNATDDQVTSLSEKNKNFEALWKSHLKQISERLISHMEKFPDNGPPSYETIFPLAGPQNLIEAVSSPVDAASGLAASTDLIFYSIFALMSLMPFANADTFDLKASMSVGAKVMQRLKTEQNDDLEAVWNEFLSEVSEKMDTVKKIKWNVTDVVDKEISDMQSTIEEAAAALEKLLMEAKANEQSKPNIDVDVKILDSCSNLFMAIQEVMKNGRQLQNEISAEGAETGSNSRPEFYRKNKKWSEGFISASKDIGRGAKVLVEAANALVNEQGKFEELIAASQEIASSTAQLVVASKVKAKSDSKNLSALSGSSRKVAEATGHVIATTRSCFSVSENETLDLDSLSFHQSKRLEMEIQIRVLELETKLEKEREKLFALRKKQYVTSEEPA